MIFNADGEVTGATIEALVKKLTLHEKSPGKEEEEKKYQMLCRILR